MTIRKGSTVKILPGARPDLQQEYGVDYEGREALVLGIQNGTHHVFVKFPGKAWPVSFAPSECIIKE